MLCDWHRFDRPYRAAWPRNRVRKYLRQNAGKDFDPQVVEAFLKLDLDTVERERGSRS